MSSSTRFTTFNKDEKYILAKGLEAVYEKTRRAGMEDDVLHLQMDILKLVMELRDSVINKEQDEQEG